MSVLGHSKEAGHTRSWDELRKVLEHEDDYFHEMIHGRHVDPHQAMVCWKASQYRPHCGEICVATGKLLLRDDSVLPVVTRGPSIKSLLSPLIWCFNQFSLQLKVQGGKSILNLWRALNITFVSMYYCDIRSTSCFFQGWSCWYPTTLSSPNKIFTLWN